MPYEMITEERYKQEISNIKPFNLQEFTSNKIVTQIPKNEVPDKFCDSAGCLVQSETVQEL